MKILLFFCLLTSMATSCYPQAEQKTVSDEVFKVVEAKGVVIPLNSRTPPRIVNLNEMPKPNTIEVPTQAGASYTTKENGIEIKVDLLPPKINPAGVFYFMRNYTTKDGLPIDVIFSSMLDRDGNLWFGTNGGGVSRFDGEYFINLNPRSQVWSILQDRSGNFWFGTENGLYQYDGTSINIFRKEQGLPDIFVRGIAEDSKGYLWLATEHGISRYDGHSFTNYNTSQGLVNNSVWSIAEDKWGNLWFGTQEGASRFDSKTFTNFTTQQGLVNNFVHSILLDKAGMLWFATEGGISRYDGNSFVNYTEKDGLVNNTVWSIFEDHEGNLWFGTEGGVSRYDGKTFTNYTEKEGLPENYVRSILEDKTGYLWFSTHLGGVCRFDGAFTNYTIAQGLTNPSVRSILQDKSGVLWFGTDSGISRYDGKTFTNYTKSQGLPNNEVRGILQDSQGNYWFGTEGGLSRFDGKSFTTFTKAQGLLHNAVRYIHEDPEKNLWLATYGGGVARFDGKTITNYTIEQGLVDNHVRDIIQDKKGNLWFGTLNGVSKFDGTTFTNFTKEQGLPNNFINSTFEDAYGNIWFSTQEGVVRYDGTTFLTFTTIEGLPSSLVYRVISSKEQYLLIGTTAGLAILTDFIPRELSHPSVSPTNKLPSQNSLTNEELATQYKPFFQVFNEKNGYPLEDLNSGQNSIFRDKNGIVWFGTGSAKTGLVRFDYDALHQNDIPPTLFINEIRIDNERIAWYDLKDEKNKKNYTVPPYITEEIIAFGRALSDYERKNMSNKFGGLDFTGISPYYYIPENLTIPFAHRQITFDFGAIEPDNPQTILYQYNLDGYNKTWSPPSNESRATFSNLYEKNYTLKIKARSPFGIWSEPMSYSFTVLPPWYRTWLAYALYAVAISTFLYLLFRWRVSALQRKFEATQNLYRAAECFVPKRFLELMQKEHFEEVKLGDSVEKDITVLFNDIRSFTTLVEKRTPKSAFDFVNRYWKFIAPIIRKHHGYIDQFQGDALLAIFPDSPEDAVQASKDMLEALNEFNIAQKEFLDEPIKMGIGISTGPAVLGIIGEPDRHVAGLISDVANTAARVEGLNKLYGSYMILSGATAQFLKDNKKFPLRKLDSVLLKGKTTPTDIYEVVEWIGNLKDITFEEYIQLYDKAFLNYASGKIQEAIVLFEQCLIYYPNDNAVETLLARCHTFLTKGVPENWTGTYILTTK